ncbi:MAG TPA: sugar phosphate isomerase/epimerase family protein [Ensifer sp.]|nr:sugar phosphate isomerase/epimerase family protein [Ensifer sp.]
MAELPVIGAAMMIADIDKHLPFLKEKDRDIEIQDFTKVDILNGDWRSVCRQALDRLGDYKGRIGIHGPFWGFTIASADPDIRTVVARRMDQGLDACAELGARYMVIHSPFTTWDYNNLPNYPAAFQTVVQRTHDTIGGAVRRAEQLGVTLVIENIEDKDPHARVRLAESFASPAVTVSIDTGHAHYAHGSTGAPPVDYYVGAAAGLLRHVHLQDADGYADRHWEIGKGSIHWDVVFDAIGMLDVQPHLMLELRDTTRIEASLEWLKQRGLAQ